MPGFPYLDLVILAMVAGFILFKLYTVLGRRTGTERTPEERMQDRIALSRMPRPKPSPSDMSVKDNVIPLPESTRAVPPDANVDTALSAPVARAILDIKLADRRFDTANFLTGARAAYEMIVTAFAKSDRDTLHSLVSDEVFGTFDTVLKTRESKNEKVDFTFVGLKSARITNAEMQGRTADVTVTFDAEFILAGYDAEGTLIEGDPKVPHRVTEVWTFARETNSGNPNWTLVGTAGG